MKNMKRIYVLIYIIFGIFLCFNIQHVNATQNEISLDEILKALDIAKLKREYDENRLKGKEGYQQPFSFHVGKLSRISFRNLDDQIIIIKLNLLFNQYYLSVIAYDPNGRITYIYKKLFIPECSEPYRDVNVDDFGFFENQKFIILEETVKYFGCFEIDNSEKKIITILNASERYKEVFKDESYFWTQNGDCYFNIYRPAFNNPNHPFWILHRKFSKKGSFLENLSTEIKWDNKLKLFIKGSTWDASRNVWIK